VTTLNDVSLQADGRTSRRRAVRMTRFVGCAALLMSALSIRVNAQNPQPYWGQDGCHYAWNGRGYATELCRRPVAAHTFDYWNPVTRQWLLRIEDNPANLYQDVTLLQGQMYGWTARLGTPRPGQNAVRAGVWAIRNPNGVWTNTLVQGGDTPAGAAAREVGNYINNRFNNRGVGIVLGGIPVIW
jgi:hypothetical protein